MKEIVKETKLIIGKKMICILGIVLVVYLLYYFSKIVQMYHCNCCIFVPLVFVFAACAGRLFERFIWDYTLDYIAIKRIGILDLLDAYLAIGGITLIIALGYAQSLENKKK